MQTTTIDFDEFMSFSFETASQKFYATNEYHLLKDKIEIMEQDYQERFSKDDSIFIENCFDVLLELEGSQAEFIYRQGYKDCVQLLKNLEVLA
ncbi:hypothetical protein SDC9_91352 [bioreactor metagenome]|uniref:Uncharacterized protein n=1 Tax=bioreactor metagenome TaxID=1076179 RepID=A0A645A1G0_9ZZZZ